MLVFREEPFMKEALDSRAMRRESSVVAGGREWTSCWISLARVIASSSLEPSGSNGVSICDDADVSISMGLWGTPHWHGYIYLRPGDKASKVNHWHAQKRSQSDGGPIGVQKRYMSLVSFSLLGVVRSSFLSFTSSKSGPLGSICSIKIVMPG